MIVVCRSMVEGIAARSSGTASSTTVRRRIERTSRVDRRLKTSIWRTVSRARWLAITMLSRSARRRVPSAASSRAASATPRMDPMMLLKSWAIPPARVPMASSFSACRRRASAACRERTSSSSERMTALWRSSERSRRSRRTAVEMVMIALTNAKFKAMTAHLSSGSDSSGGNGTCASLAYPTTSRLRELIRIAARPGRSPSSRAVRAGTAMR